MNPQFPTRVCGIVVSAVCILIAFTHTADAGLIGDAGRRGVWPAKIDAF